MEPFGRLGSLCIIFKEICSDTLTRKLAFEIFKASRFLINN